MKGTTYMKKIIAVAAGALVLTAGTVGGATAGSLITSRQIEDNTIQSRDVANESLRVADLRPGAVDRLSGSDGEQGEQGVPGEQGPKGDPGAPGKDAQALPYGMAQVKVSRGSGAANPWAIYSTTIGSPVGDTTGGTFRFSCSEAQAPCKVSVAGYATQDGATVYPRVSIQTQSLNGGPLTYCEYGDGTTNNGTFSDTLSTDANAPTAMTLGIGNSADCGIAGPAGTVDAISVPAGYYDVTSTFQFVGAAN